MALTLHPRRFKVYQRPSAEQIGLLEKDLHGTGLLDNDFVILVGGIALALHAGDFYRHHADIDLGIFEADIPRFYALAERNGYTITERMATGHLSPQYDFSFVRKIPAARMVTSKHPRAIRNLRPFVLTNRATFIDVFIYIQSSNFVEAPLYKLRFPQERVFPITRKTLSCGLTLNLPNPAHILDLKRSDRRTVNTNDLNHYAYLDPSNAAATPSKSARGNAP